MLLKTISQSVQSLSHIWLFATPWTAARQVLCPSPTPRTCSNSCSWCWWCHPTISSSVIPFSSCLQSFPSSESFPVSQLFASGGQSIRVSASASVLPMNIQGWFPLGLTGLISLLSKDSQESSLAPQLESINSSVVSPLYSPTLCMLIVYNKPSDSWIEYWLCFVYPQSCDSSLILPLDPATKQGHLGVESRWSEPWLCSDCPVQILLLPQDASALWGSFYHQPPSTEEKNRLIWGSPGKDARKSRTWLSD